MSLLVLVCLQLRDSILHHLHSYVHGETAIAMYVEQIDHQGISHCIGISFI